ncbi:MAG: TonB-dependent receptor [Thiobacillus sp. SCN 63-374]|nr:MAG: TonB-dependent receptor [Thiobacillus sp. SCN 63-374]
MEDDRKPAWMRWGGVALSVIAAVLIALWLKSVLVSAGPVKKPTIQQITLVRPPPPPPPPPEEKPPEPEVKEEVKLDQPQPTPEPQQADAPPPDGIAEGPEGGMATDIARGVPTLPGSSGGNPWGRYDALLNEAASSAFQQALAREKALKNKNYKVIVKVWIDASGKVSRTALVESTGDARADEVLREALNGMRALREPPPADMPQPVKIRVTSRA